MRGQGEELVNGIVGLGNGRGRARARLCYHIGGNPPVHNRGKPGVEPGSDYNPITPFTFTITPR